MLPPGGYVLPDRPVPKGLAFLLCAGSPMRVACYVDGFNLYHAIHDLQKPHLKWVNLWALAQSICRSGETLTKVAYFSAYATWIPTRMPAIGSMALR